MKIVITGGPSCGKTSLINALESYGYTVKDEIARNIILEKNMHKKSLDDSEFMDFQREIYSRGIEREHQIDKNHASTYFLDRAIPDGHGYCLNRFGHIPAEILNIPTRRYDKIFVLEPLPFKDDGLRLEKNQKEAMMIHKNIIDAYKINGYDIITVPKMPGQETESIRKRAEFIIDNFKI